MGNFCSPSPLGAEAYCGPSGSCVVGANQTSYCQCNDGVSNTLSSVFRAPDCYEPNQFALGFEIVVAILSLASLCVLRLAVFKRRPVHADTLLRLDLVSVSLLLWIWFAVSHRIEHSTVGPASLVLLFLGMNTLLLSQMWLELFRLARLNNKHPWTAVIMKSLFAGGLLFQIVCIEWAISDSNLDDQFSYYGYSSCTAAYGLCFSLTTLAGTLFTLRETKARVPRSVLVRRGLLVLSIAVPSILMLAWKSLPYNVYIFLTLCLVPAYVGFEEALGLILETPSCG